jgi:hypothetical protein
MDTPPFECNFAYEASDGAAPVGLEMDCFILGIECASGDVYELTVWTEAYLARVREQDRETGTYLGGQYLTTPDLIVARHDVDLIECIVAELIRTNDLREAWHIPDELTACWVECDPVPDDQDEFDDTWQVTPVPEAGCCCMRGLRTEG